MPAQPGGAIAIIGDLHSAWDVEDLGYFNRSGYPILLVTGDLGRTRSQDGRRVARSLSHLTAEVLVIPGNNDVDEYPHIRAELTYRRARADLLEDTDAPDLPDATAEPQTDKPAAEPPRLCGYSLHPISLHGLELSLVAGRPFSMGGPQLAFPEALSRLYQVHSLQDSIDRLCALVDAADTEHIVFFAHNGPTGLGATPQDIWGRDFHADAGDWGDPDLRVAIDHARRRGQRVTAVIAGHMHWELRGSPHAQRRWQLQHEGTLYVNAARVPRIFSEGDLSVRQHIHVQLTASGAWAEERLVREAAQSAAPLLDR